MGNGIAKAGKRRFPYAGYSLSKICAIIADKASSSALPTNGMDKDCGRQRASGRVAGLTRQSGGTGTAIWSIEQSSLAVGSAGSKPDLAKCRHSLLQRSNRKNAAPVQGTRDASRLSDAASVHFTVPHHKFERALALSCCAMAVPLLHPRRYGGDAYA